MQSLQRFIDAQQSCFDQVCQELASGKKQTHWMWFVFPQLAGLGRTRAAQFYAIRDEEEARSFIRHPILSKNLIQCTELVLQHRNLSAHQIFGVPDDLKFHSCMTLFAEVSTVQCFPSALTQFYDGKRDLKTLGLLGRAG
jgi:uncharacterized protein (DUF1810 family)